VKGATEKEEGKCDRGPKEGRSKEESHIEDREEKPKKEAKKKGKRDRESGNQRK
jgi:hypothetical protein